MRRLLLGRRRARRRCCCSLGPAGPVAHNDGLLLLPFTLRSLSFMARRRRWHFPVAIMLQWRITILWRRCCCSLGPACPVVRKNGLLLLPFTLRWQGLVRSLRRRCVRNSLDQCWWRLAADGIRLPLLLLLGLVRWRRLAAAGIRLPTLLLPGVVGRRRAAGRELLALLLLVNRRGLAAERRPLLLVVLVLAVVLVLL